MTDPNSASTPHSYGELREFPDGAVLKVYKQEGDVFTMAELAEPLAIDPAAVAIGGCVYVQTVEGEGEDSRRHRYFFDTDAVFAQTENKAAHTDGPIINNPDYKITIGQQWQSPIGPTRGTVETVAIPWTRGYDASATHPGKISPLPYGRRSLDWVAAQPR